MDNDKKMKTSEQLYLWMFLMHLLTDVHLVSSAEHVVCCLHVF